MTDDQLARFGDTAGILPGMPRRLHLVRTGAEQLPPDVLAAADTAESAADAEARQQMRDAQRAFRDRAWTEACPAPFRRAAVDGLEPPQDPRGAVTGWLDGPQRTLLLHGPSRRGKSYAAYAAGHAARARGQWVTGYTAKDLLDRLRPSVIDPARPERTQQAVTGADLLILDDLGAEKHDTDWSAAEIVGVLEARIAGGGRLIVTTNLGARELAEAYGERVVYRLVESATIVLFDGPIMKPRPAF
jgi:DNA replication protein DnaC